MSSWSVHNLRCYQQIHMGSSWFWLSLLFPWFVCSTNPIPSRNHSNKQLPISTFGIWRVEKEKRGDFWVGFGGVTLKTSSFSSGICCLWSWANIYIALSHLFGPFVYKVEGVWCIICPTRWVVFAFCCYILCMTLTFVLFCSSMIVLVFH